MNVYTHGVPDISAGLNVFTDVYNVVHFADASDTVIVTSEAEGTVPTCASFTVIEEITLHNTVVNSCPCPSIVLFNNNVASSNS